MQTSKKSSTRQATPPRRPTPPTPSDHRQQRLAALALTFSMTAVLAACGGGADNNAAAGEASQGSAATPGATTAVKGATATRAQALAVVDTWVPCGAEGDVCSVPDTRVVRYGANGSYLYKTVTGAIGCGNSDWADPLFGVAKACAYSANAGLPAPDTCTRTGARTRAGTALRRPPASWVACASEGGTCAVPGTRNVRYGANGSYAVQDGDAARSPATTASGAIRSSVSSKPAPTPATRHPPRAHAARRRRPHRHQHQRRTG